MKDPTSGIRKKIRAVAEIRYPAAPTIFDIRGKIIESIHPEIRDYLQHWRTDISSVTFSQNLNKPSREFIISHNRTAIILEDIGSIQEFVDKTNKYFSLMYQQVGKSIDRLDRIGVRLIEIFNHSETATFDDMAERVNNSFLKLPQDLSIYATDLSLKMNHRNGYFQIGPVKEDENWVKQFFSDNDKSIPKVGIGIDVDSFATDIEIKSSQDLLSAFQTVYKISKSIEESLMRHVGMINEKAS